MTSSMRAVLSWGVLIALTFVSVYISKVMDVSTTFLVSIFAIVFIKGQQITDVFMELKHAPRKWRVLFLCYVLIVPGTICMIYVIW